MSTTKKAPTLTLTDPDFIQADLAIRRAAIAARKLSRQTKTPFYVMKDGKIVDLNAPRPRPAKKPAAPPANAGEKE